MKRSPQDDQYLGDEGDAFFERNMKGVDPGVLRPYKQRIVEQIAECGLTPRRLLEYGCNYGDLLAHYARTAGAECVGVEASPKAVAFGEQAYGDEVRIVNGSIAQNPINEAGATGQFDLVVVDDVLCWVSRETLFQSIANIDDALADGGHLFLREFYPDKNRRNANHHVADGSVYCYKPAGPHYRMFTSGGSYEVVWQHVSTDGEDHRAAGRDPFDARWVDTILRKSFNDYFTSG